MRNNYLTNYHQAPEHLVGISVCPNPWVLTRFAGVSLGFHKAGE